MIGHEQLLATVFWATELPRDEQERVRLGISLRTLQPGTSLIHRGDFHDSWTGVINCFLKLGSVSKSGKAVSYVGLAPSCWFGEGSLLKNEPRQYDVTALRCSQIAQLDRNTFFWLYENSVTFNRLLVRLINERLSHLIAIVENERTLHATGKVARSLAWLFNPVISPFIGSHIHISQAEIGMLAGVSRQVANQTLRELGAARLLRNERGRITILDLAKLRSYGD